MAKSPVRPEQNIPFQVSEAQDCLNIASHALTAITTLLSGYNNASALKAESLYYLLMPVLGNVDAALDELNSMGGNNHE